MFLFFCNKKKKLSTRAKKNKAPTGDISNLLLLAVSSPFSFMVRGSHHMEVGGKAGRRLPPSPSPVVAARTLDFFFPFWGGGGEGDGKLARYTKKKEKRRLRRNRVSQRHSKVFVYLMAPSNFSCGEEKAFVGVLRELFPSRCCSMHFFFLRHEKAIFFLPPAPSLSLSHPHRITTGCTPDPAW